MQRQMWDLVSLPNRGLNVDYQEDDMIKKLYSYHTFLYPFSYEGLKKEHFVSDSWEEENLPKEIKQDTKMRDSDILLYNKYQYFFPKARKNLFNYASGDSEKAVSRHYRFKRLKNKDNFYIIRSGAGEYKLDLKEIRLSLYSEFEIGVLSFETEYYTDNDKGAFDDVLEINQLGRRLFPPCIALDNAEDGFKSILTAEELCVNGETEYKIEFNRKQYQIEPGMELIRRILGIESQEEVRIKSVLDDRMFVACLIKDEKISNMSIVKHLEDEIEQKQAKDVYQFVFADGKEGCSCQSRRMMKKALRDHVYDRWADWGTFYGITEYSLVCATGESDELNETVINPFVTIYVEMAKLALAQRAAITNMENKILEEIVNEGAEKNVSEKIKKNKNKKEKINVNKIYLEHIRQIWKMYVSFQNKLFLPEVTFQQQGVEIYQILKESLKIDVMNSHLEKELDHLHNVAELDYQTLEREAEDRIDYAINFVTIFGLTLALISVAQDFLCGFHPIRSDLENCLISCGVWAGSVLLIVASILLFWRMMKGKHKDLKEKKYVPGILVMVIIVYFLLLLVVA